MKKILKTIITLANNISFFETTGCKLLVLTCGIIYLLDNRQHYDKNSNNIAAKTDDYLSTVS